MTEITEQEAYEMYNKYLDGFKVRHPATNMRFPGSYALKRLDKLAYESHFEDYVESLYPYYRVQGYTAPYPIENEEEKL